MTKNLYFRRVRAASPPLSEVLRDILVKHYGLSSGPNGDDPEGLRLTRERDWEYLKGLSDAGTPGADLLLGVIEADGEVAIWVGD